MSLTCGQKQTLFVNRSYRFSSIFRKSSLSIIETNLKQTVKKVSFQIIKKVSGTANGHSVHFLYYVTAF